jgi:oxygen-independent coproporphyrinogen-3 oxidase
VLKAGPRVRASFADQLIAEAELVADAGLGERLTGFDTVYFGGGTPSILPVEELARIVGQAGRRLGVREDAWICLEANPEDVTAESLRAWRALGVRMLSLGVQSFDDGELRFLGRRHTAAQAVRAVEMAREAGFETVSVDLIFALPGQSEAAWRRNLEQAVALAPDHLSCYELTVHEGTPFERLRRRGELVEEDDEARAERFLFTHRYLADAGYPGYEVSNFARTPEHRSRHNRKYWDHTPYLGLGPSAHSFDGERRRWWNERKLADYRRLLAAGAAPRVGEETLSRDELALEALLLGLRTVAGLERVRFAARFGADPASAVPVAELASRGLMVVDGDRLRPTLDGLVIADSLAVAIADALPAGVS